MERVLIVMSSGPETPRRCAAPFYYASVAAAMDYEVTMYFTMDGTLLLQKGRAGTVYAKPDGKPISHFMQDALEAGTHFVACTASMDLHGLQAADMIDGVRLAGGATLWELAEEAKAVLSF
jgi:predicted peroxiredoxin